MGQEMVRQDRIASAEADRAAKEQQQLDRDAAIFEARSKLDAWERERVHDPERGLVTLRGRDAFDIPKVLGEEFDKFADEVISAGAPDKRTDLTLRELVRARRDQLMNWGDRHTLQQRDLYHEERYQADLLTFEQNAATFAADPARVRAEIAIQADRTVSYLRSKGKSEEVIQAALRDNASKAHVSVLNSLIDADNPEAADAYLKSNAGSINAPELLRASKVIEKQMDTLTGLRVASEAVQTAVVKAQPSDIGRLSNLAGIDTPALTALVMQAESGGRRYAADGKTLLTSPKGAKGEMQVMDGTNRDPGFGVVPARDNSPEERARVGRDYLAAMVKRYAGNVPKALAAYNAGPGTVDNAIKAWEKDAAERARRGSNADWMDYLQQFQSPANNRETLAYVSKIAAAYAGGQGQPPKPTLQEIHATIRERIGTNRPEALKVALADSSRQFAEAEKAEKQRGEESTQAAMLALQQNGGRVSLLPERVRAAIPPEKMDEVMNYGARIAKGDDITDPIVFQKMATDDAWLRNLSDAEFFNHSRKLSQADAQQMALRRGKLINPAEGKSDPMSLDHAGINTLVNNRLLQAGQDPTPKDGSKDAQRIGALRKVVWDQVMTAQVASGKRFSDVELTRKVDELFATNMQVQGWFGSEKSKPLLTAGVGDIPATVKSRLKADFRAQGVTDPTDADLLSAYMNLTLAQRNAPPRAAAPAAPAPAPRPVMSSAAAYVPGQAPGVMLPPVDTARRQSGTIQ